MKNKNIKKNKSKKHKLIFFLFILMLHRFLITKTNYNDSKSKFGYIDACD